MGFIRATCGHEVENIDDLKTVALAEYSRLNQRCVSYSSVCESCYKKAELEGLILYDQDEENTWLGIDYD